MVKALNVLVNQWLDFDVNRKEKNMSKNNKMRHYEVVFLVHPEQEEQVQNMVDKYRKVITDANGKIHRFEDWGRRPLAYAINDVRKAHYFLMNVEAPASAIAELEGLFKFNDAIIRNLIMKVKKSDGNPSPILKMKAKEERRAAYAAENYSTESSESDEEASEQVA